MNHEDVEHLVADHLQQRLGGRLRNFRLSIHENGLVLQGRVPTYYGKLTAQELARDISGRTVTANEIEVV